MVSKQTGASEARPDNSTISHNSNEPIPQSNLNQTLLRCWIEVVEMGMAYVGVIFLILGVPAAFLFKHFQMKESGYTYSFAYLVFCFMFFVVLVMKLLSSISARKSSPGHSIGLVFPRNLRELQHLGKVIMPTEFYYLSRKSQLIYLMDSFKDQFNHWTDHLRNLSTLALAISAVMGLQSNTTPKVFAVIAIISSWTYFVSFYLNTYTQRGMRFFRHQILLSEIRSNPNAAPESFR